MTTRHVKVVFGPYKDGCTESDTSTVAKKIYDVIATASAYTISVTIQGEHIIAVITYDVT